jgi:branched-chain amino acid aminotransferase
MTEHTWTFFEGAWHPGNVRIMGPRTHAAWLGSSVFDGARAFEGVTPDIDRHFRRVNESAVNVQLNPVVSVETWLDLARDGVARFPRDAALYIRPMYWAEQNGPLAIAPDAASTNWCLSIYLNPMPAPDGGSVTLSPFRRPTIETMPTNAKAGCLYPNNARAIVEARSRGFDNCVMCDMLGNVAELANSNFFIAKDGIVLTPLPNGTFLDGITRQRVIFLLRHAGVEVVEAVLRYRDVQAADEIFSTGNYGKVVPITRVDDRSLPPGPKYQLARRLYWDFAHS